MSDSCPPRHLDFNRPALDIHAHHRVAQRVHAVVIRLHRLVEHALPPLRPLLALELSDRVDARLAHHQPRPPVALHDQTIPHRLQTRVHGVVRLLCGQPALAKLPDVVWLGRIAVERAHAPRLPHLLGHRHPFLYAALALVVLGHLPHTSVPVHTEYQNDAGIG